MSLEIVSSLGRAGNTSNREAKKIEWDLKYGKDNWQIIYKYKDKIMTREEALRDIYYKSYYLYLKNNSNILETLCKSANTIYNPHSFNTGGVDLQCPAVLDSLEKLNRKLEGTERIAIGTWGTKKGLEYPKISYTLSPYNVPIWFDTTISVEKFWQEYKFLAIKK